MTHEAVFIFNAELMVAVVEKLLHIPTNYMHIYTLVSKKLCLLSMCLEIGHIIFNHRSCSLLGVGNCVLRLLQQLAGSLRGTGCAKVTHIGLHGGYFLGLLYQGKENGAHISGVDKFGTTELREGEPCEGCCFDNTV